MLRRLPFLIKRTMSTRYFADKEVPVSRLEARPFFESLDAKEKKYAHYMSRAAFEGTRVIIEQTNPKGGYIYDMIINIFKDTQGHMIDVNTLHRNSGVSSEIFDQFLQYSAQFLGNLSNYKSFGDEKFIPRLDESSFETIVRASGSTQAIQCFQTVRRELFDTEPVSRNLLGFPEDGHLSGYYSDDITKHDIQLVQTFLEKNKIDPLNTRLFKHPQGYELKVASAEASHRTLMMENGQSLIITYGDFQPCMKKITQAMEDALPFVANDTQKQMLIAYANSFRTGSIQEHMKSQELWLKDISPHVETNIGFIETYRDPQGVRAEWEGFVAMVNKEQTIKFNRLVENASLFVSRLPWPAAFERETLNKPDFTSLEVLSFATGGIPAGINIPNYSSITQLYGSKNVSLGNVISAQSPNEKFPFIREQDLELYRKYRNASFEVQVGTHELGHGTGKLLTEDEHGTLNFDRSLSHPLVPKITTWYKPGQNFNSMFKSIASSYEECRAECIALSLSPHKDILKIFNYEGQEAEDILYIMYLNMARAGLAALEFYNPVAKKWGQAHMQARYAIMNVMLKAGHGFLVLEPHTLDIHLDRTKIRSVGAPAVSEFLTKLQIYKATADEVKGTELYMEATHVPDQWTEIRDKVMAAKQPRKAFVQGNTFIEDGKVVLKEYEATATGLIQSYVERQV
ncbi:dipeptidyl peptidase III [Pilobolus umbonatus]|nr:dipeptidyl peptidase III [Pilobolus umbonatus]